MSLEKQYIKTLMKNYSFIEKDLLFYASSVVEFNLEI